jgi:cyclic beta-1,2-glucan synthetase
MAQLDHPESFERQSILAWTRSQVQTRHCGLSLADAAIVQKLARYLVYPDHALRSAQDFIASGLGSQSALWPLGISGDFPILALRISDQADLAFIGQALRMHELLRARGLIVDFVVVNEQASSYVQDLQVAIDWLCENARLRGDEHGPREHIFTVRRDLMGAATYQTLLAVARVVLHTRNGTIEDQMERAEARRRLERVSERLVPPGQASAGKKADERRRRETDANLSEDLQFWNGFGGFSPDGREYVVRLDGGGHTPHPWVNVVSNTEFGFHVSAEGAAFSWSRNSRDFQLTPWSNDPVVNRPGEGLFVRDIESGGLLSPFAALVPDPDARYEARHGHGYSTFTAERDDLAVEATMLVDEADPVRITRLTIRNRSTKPRRLRVYAYAEWVLSDSRWKSAPTIVPSRDEATGALLARNPYSMEFSDRVAFLASDAPSDGWTTDRKEFIGHHGSTFAPAAPVFGHKLSGLVAAGHDPCAAIARDIEIGPEAEMETLWLLGDAASEDEACKLVRLHAAKSFDERLARNKTAWEDTLGTLQVKTPDAALDAMVNGWLPYQAIACRIRARAAFYQASGAFGFRDQLQDTLALLLHDPSLARAQILNAASRQFPEGDVQHWWLPRSGAGVRTMISDDVVWLGYGVAHYLATTGDASILDEETPFILGDPLEPGQHDAFFTPRESEEKATVYEHCARALDLAIQRKSKNGLPLILGGDWNDGMNRVGEEGRGESVWLGWFLLKTLHDFAPIAKERGDSKRASRWLAHARQLKSALEATAWDGEWYRRGSFDDGSPLGSRNSDECRIDSIAQSWSVLSGRGDPQRSESAMNAVTRMLVDKELQIIRLFTPPFDKTDKEPGYIKSYPPGVRENGGQYTHAAAWFALALSEAGRADDALAALRMLLPVNHALDREAAEHYRVEPYVVAADIYSEVDRAGRGGWTWYTGSAGWVYRAAVEGILGIRRQGDKLLLRPVLPSEWPGFSARLKFGASTYDIEVSRNARQSAPSAELDGAPTEMNERHAAVIPIEDKGEHVVRFVVGKPRRKSR